MDLFFKGSADEGYQMLIQRRRIAKSNLLLGRMDIDVNQGGVDLDQKGDLRIPSLHEALPVSFHNRSGNHSIPDVSVVDIDQDPIPPGPALIRGAQEGLEPHTL